MKFIMKQICLALYLLGHLISITTMEVSWLGFTYHIYNKLMGWSFFINEKYGFDVWEEED